LLPPDEGCDSFRDLGAGVLPPELEDEELEDEELEEEELGEVRLLGAGAPPSPPPPPPGPGAGPAGSVRRKSDGTGRVAGGAVECSATIEAARRIGNDEEAGAGATNPASATAVEVRRTTSRAAA
jgi:hypothetical protein